MVQQAKLAPEAGNPGGHVGKTVAIVGETVVLGADDRLEDGAQPGAAYVFERTGESWSERTKLVPEDRAALDRFADSLAVSENTVIGGAPFADEPNGENAGAAYVFERSGGSWAQTAKLVAPDGDPKDNFGTSVALAGETALVGASSDEDRNGPESGSVYVFERAKGSWTHRATLAPDDGMAGMGFGWTVALSNRTALVGAPFTDDPNGDRSGAVYVFERSDGEWIQRAKLTPEGGDPRDRFGWDVALVDGAALVGTPEESDPNGPEAGAAYVFERVDGSWRERTKLVPGDGDPRDSFGETVALGADFALVGAPDDDEPNGENAGSAYLYDVE